MEWVETTGRTLAEAKDAALDQLGVDETDAEFVVVSEPKAGLFGRLRGEARVRARVRPVQARPKRGRERRSGGGGSRARSASGERGSGNGGSSDDSSADDATRGNDDDGDEATASGSRASQSRSRAGGSRSAAGRPHDRTAPGAKATALVAGDRDVAVGTGEAEGVETDDPTPSAAGGSRTRRRGGRGRGGARDGSAADGEPGERRGSQGAGAPAGRNSVGDGSPGGGTATGTPRGSGSKASRSAEESGAGSPAGPAVPGAGRARRSGRAAPRAGSAAETASAEATSDPALQDAGTEAVDDEERVPSYGAQKEDPVGEMTLQEQGDAARIFVEGLVDRLGLRASVAIRTTAEDTVSVDVDGEGLGTLVGPGGTTLAALQELTRTYVQKITGGQSDRILVDVAGYRAKRVEALQRFTQGVADEVLASGTAKALEPMSAADRKVVHDTVNAIDGVVTRSEGEDPRRYIVLAPVDGGQG